MNNPFSNPAFSMAALSRPCPATITPSLPVRCGSIFPA